MRRVGAAAGAPAGADTRRVRLDPAADAPRLRCDESGRPHDAELMQGGAIRYLGAMELMQTRSILTVALMAAFADGAKDERERESLRRLAETLGATDTAVDLPGLYREVLLEKPHLDAVVAPLTTPEMRQFAYEMAVGVVNADGAQGPAEVDFLARLADA